MTEQMYETRKLLIKAIANKYPENNLHTLRIPGLQIAGMI